MSRTMKDVPYRVTEDRDIEWTGAERHRCGNNRGWQVAERHRTGNLRGGPCLVADSNDKRCQQQSSFQAAPDIPRPRFTRREVVKMLYYGPERARVRDQLHLAVNRANSGIEVASIEPIEQHRRELVEVWGF